MGERRDDGMPGGPGEIQVANEVRKRESLVGPARQELKYPEYPVGGRGGGFHDYSVGPPRGDRRQMGSAVDPTMAIFQINIHISDEKSSSISKFILSEIEKSIDKLEIEKL